MSQRCEDIPCKSLKRTEWRNGIWCFGHRRARTHRPCDTVCWCELTKTGKHRRGIMVTPAEAAAIIEGFAGGIQEGTLPGEARCRKTKCTERQTCQNAA